MKMKARFAPAIALTAAAALVTGCGSEDAPAENTAGASASATSAAKIDVTVTLHPVNYLAQRIGGDHANVTNLGKSAASPHDFELSAKDIVTVTKSDVLFYLSGDLQPAVAKAAEGDVKKVAVDLVKPADLALRAGDVVTIGKKNDHDDHGHDHKDEKKKKDDHGHDHDHKDEKEKKDDHGHDHKDEKKEEKHDDHDHKDEKKDKKKDEHGHDDHHHDPNSADPHFWLDPVRMIAVAESMKTTMSEKNPDAAKHYEANTEKLVADLKKLDQDYKTGLTSCKSKTFVSNHTAFAYLAKRYGLTQVGISGLHPDDEPAPKTLTALAKYVKDNKVPTIYYETNASTKIAETLAKETGAKTGVLDPIATITKDSAADNYLGIMEANLKALQTGLSCS